MLSVTKKDSHLIHILRERNILDCMMACLSDTVVIQQQLLLPTEVKRHLFTGPWHIPAEYLLLWYARAKAFVVLDLLQNQSVLKIPVQ